MEVCRTVSNDWNYPSFIERVRSKWCRRIEESNESERENKKKETLTFGDSKSNRCSSRFCVAECVVLLISPSSFFRALSSSLCCKDIKYHARNV